MASLRSFYGGFLKTAKKRFVHRILLTPVGDGTGSQYMSENYTFNLFLLLSVSVSEPVCAWWYMMYAD